MIRSARTVVAGLGLGALLASSLTAGPVAASPVAAVPPPTPELTVETVARGLVVPWDLDFLPDGRMLVTEREGRIRLYSSGSPGASVERTVTVPDVRVINSQGVTGEGGVLGLAVDTDFAAHPYVYVCASRDYSGSGGWVNQVLRYRVGSSGALSGPTVLLGGMRASRTHNGCAVEMDEDGLLWVGMGDAGNGARAQDRTGLNGKVLRMTRTGGVPTDNPVIDGTRDQVYSMGHRNPQGIVLDPGSDRVYVVEHGPGVDDEVNLLRAGGNYGWPCYTDADHPNDTTGCGPAADYLPPVWASGNPTIATSGGSIARGAQWGDAEGDLFVSVLKDQEVRRLQLADDGSVTAEETLFEGDYGRLRASVQGPGGRLYLTTSNGSDRVLRVSAAETSVQRVGGDNRYEVAAGVSERTHPGGASDVVVATGAVYPDALAGSAAGGAFDMPVLLTRDDGLPDSTRGELVRLAPERVWVLGGTTSVSDDVLDELDALLPGAETTRIGGPNRYAVAAGVSRQWHRGSVDTLFLASGQVFADALAAAPAAARNDAPLLLVRRDSVPSATGEEIKRLAPRHVVVLGGENTVSEETVRSLRHVTSAPVDRIGGANRYAVAQNLAREYWTTSDADIASGETFADGLTGGASAGTRGVPLLLARATTVPPATGQQLLRLAPTHVRVYGGPVTVPPALFDRYEALAGTP